MFYVIIENIGELMKRLFRIGSGLFIYSIIPILSWIVLSYVLGDNRIANVFSLTYAIQFVWLILRSFFGSGANVRKEKENNPNAVWNSIFWGTIFSILIFAIPLIFVDKYIAFFGQDVEFYRIYVIYGIALLFLQTLFSFIIEKLYFEDKEKTANIHLFAFNLTTFAVLILSSLIIPNTLIALLLTLGVLLIYIVCLYVWQFEKFKIDFTFFKNFKYESAHIVSSIFMMIIYLFGYRNAFSLGEEYLVALNIVALSTDPQWDMLEAVNTASKVDISKQRFQYKKLVCNSYMYVSILAISSIIMTLILSQTREVVMIPCLIYLGIQIIDMFLYTFEIIMSNFTQLEYSPKLNTIIQFSLLGIRTIIATFLISPYCTEFAQLVNCILGFTIYLIIRFAKYKIVDNKLMVKNKNLNTINNKKTLP